VVAPDLRGFGYSAKPAADYDAATMAADLAALSDHLGLRDVTVIGHDWGAVFAYVYAAKYPGQVRALGIVEMALPGVGVMEQAMAPQPDGNFLWHMGFQSVPDLPELLIARGGVPFYFGGTSLLIMVGVGLDTVKQIESQLQQRNYEGFLR